MAAVGTWAMEQEEAASGGSKFIEEEARLRAIGLFVDRHVKRIWLARNCALCCRRSALGPWGRSR